MTKRLPTTRNKRGLTRSQEAFCVLVAQSVPTKDAVQQIYVDNHNPARYAGDLMSKVTVTERIAVLENQRDRIRELTRDTLTIKTLDTVDLAIEDKKYSAAFTGLRLTGDLQGLTQSNPVAEATQAFLLFLSGSDSGRPAVVGDVRVLDS